MNFFCYRYAKNSKKLSAIFRDATDKPLDRAIFWTEYAIRHKGAPHLRMSSRNLTWYQNLMLDVLAIIFAALFAALFIVWKLLRLVFSLGSPETQAKQKKVKTK